MTNRSRTFCIPLAVLISLYVNHSLAEVLSAPHVDLELVSATDHVEPTKPFCLAVRIKPENGWHLYWKNPGDSGLPPKFIWHLPSGYFPGGLMWPYPERISYGPLVNYGYKSEVFLPMVISPAAHMGPEEAEFSVDGDWIICKEECIPGKGSFSLKLKVSNAKAQETEWATEIRKAVVRVPAEIGSITVKPTIRDELLKLELSDIGETLPAGKITFFPSQRGIIENASEQKVSQKDDRIEITVTKSRTNPHINRVAGVLVAEDGWPSARGRKAIEFESFINPGDNTSVKNSLPAVSNNVTIWFAILLAFVGGLILNLMPCVFPILALKILGFVQNASKDPKAVRKHGLYFALGVILSFWLLAGLLFVLKASGAELGWGFQLQSPLFVLVLVFVMCAVSLNLFGIFEVEFSAPIGDIKELSSGSYFGSFLNGLLATILATPCTAPFMGVAVAAALTKPNFVGFLIFTSLGLGMAAPYVILSMSPSLCRALPKPGRWMKIFKIFMGFPMLATLLWLCWVYSRLVGSSAITFLLVGLLLFAVGLWIFGKLHVPSATKSLRVAGVLLLVLLTISGFYVSALGTSFKPESVAEETREDGLIWEKYSSAKLDQYLQQDKAVFIDFTAAWCLTCQVNERLVFNSQEVQDELRSLGVVLLRADWTSKDAEIAKDIERYGRSGVPLYVLYPKGFQGKPFIFPTILMPGSFLEDLNDHLR